MRRHKYLFYLLVFLQIGQFELSYCGNTVGHPVPMLKNALDSNDSSLPVTYSKTGSPPESRRNHFMIKYKEKYP